MLTSPPPLAFSWADLIDAHAAERGSLAALARALQDAAPGLSADPLTVERGLRRLRGRGAASGDKYGRLLLRTYGLPGAVEDWARRLGQYHSRLMDIPHALRRNQLRLWDRPPVAESPAAAWIHLGLASLAHLEGAMDLVRRRLDLAAVGVRRAGPEADLERALFEARLSAQGHEAPWLAAAASRLADADLSPHARACYRARLQDQRGWRAARGWRGDPSRLATSLALIEAIPLEGPPFAAFRRAHSRAWCLWRMGRRDDALVAARAAVTAAGDGGFLRFRRMGLTLLAAIAGGDESSRDEGASARRRAAAIERRLRDG